MEGKKSIPRNSSRPYKRKFNTIVIGMGRTTTAVLMKFQKKRMLPRQVEKKDRPPQGRLVVKRNNLEVNRAQVRELRETD